MDTDLPNLLDDLESIYTTYKLQTVTNPEAKVGGTLVPTFFKS